MTDLFSDREWFAVVVKPGRNEEVDRRFRAQGYRSFLPMCVREIRNGPGRKKLVCRPLFMRYQFVGVDLEQPFGPITNTVGVDFVVRGAAHLPVRVPVLALRKIARRIADDGGVADLREAIDWKPEQALRVLDGAFGGFPATLLEMDPSQELAKVLVHLFGRRLEVEMSVENLEAAA